MSADLWERNLRIIQHEIDTPWRDHDPDGECCRAAAEAEPVDEDDQP